MSRAAFPARGLYLITPDHDDSDALLAQVTRLLPYAACLQYRNKRAGAAQRLREARDLRAACRSAGVFFIVNDDAALALAADADGVHLGDADGGIEAARALLGDGRAIGISCYDDIERARQATERGADYIAFGALFASSTKPNARRATPALFAEAKPLGLPMVAIGGITPDNTPFALAAGADLVAVIAGVFDAPNPLAAARAYAAAFV